MATKKKGTSAPALDERGFGVAPELVPVGTDVHQEGESVRRARKQWEDLPTVHEAATHLIEHVRTEQRVDEVVPFNALTMDERGCLVHEGKNIAAEPNGFRQLCTRAGIPGGSGYLFACPPALRAQNLNHWLSHTEGEVKLRLRNRDNVLSLYAGVSSKYASYDAPDLLADAADLLPPDARVEASYDGLSLRFRTICQSDLEAPQKNDVFKAGVEVTSADDGTRALHIAAVFWRVMCTNLMVFKVSRGTTRKRIHKGSLDDMAASLFLGVRDARQAISPFQTAWQEARGHDVVQVEAERTSVLESLLQKKFLQAPGVRNDDVLSALLTAWAQEGGSTRADLVNAVTRAAHEASWPSARVAEELETQAGVLLTASF